MPYKNEWSEALPVAIQYAARNQNSQCRSEVFFLDQGLASTICKASVDACLLRLPQFDVRKRKPAVDPGQVQPSCSSMCAGENIVSALHSSPSPERRGDRKGVWACSLVAESGPPLSEVF